LGNDEVQAFIGTEAYLVHKQKRFPPPDLAIPIKENEAFLLNDEAARESFKKRYKSAASLYYNGQPEFGTLLERIKENIDRL
jgi:hypothetical protein